VIRVKIWFRCAAMHDPVTPIVLQLGDYWMGSKEKKGRDPDRESVQYGEELVRRMKGWITVDPDELIKIVNQYGRLKVLDERELVVEVEKTEDITKASKGGSRTFQGEVDIESISKK